MYFWAIEGNVNLINMYLFNSYCMQWDAYICCMRWSASKKGVSRSVLSNSLQPHGLYPARLLCPRNSPGKNTSVGSHFLLQGILPIQGLNLSLLHCSIFFTVWATREARSASSLRSNTHAWELGSNLSSATDLLNELGQTASPFWAKVSPLV